MAECARYRDHGLAFACLVKGDGRAILRNDVLHRRSWDVDSTTRNDAFCMASLLKELLQDWSNDLHIDIGVAQTFKQAVLRIGQDLGQLLGTMAQGCCALAACCDESW